MFGFIDYVFVGVPILMHRNWGGECLHEVTNQIYKGLQIRKSVSLLHAVLNINIWL